MEIVAVGTIWRGGDKADILFFFFFFRNSALFRPVQLFQVILGEEWIALGLDPRSTFHYLGIDPFSEMSVQDRRLQMDRKIRS